ncbi:FAD:protein FMN transferase [Winogradskyella sp. PE311]|uniref:FAD:protein FMN transferase n=1 Tax=Winogradskyella sp. PE311 TaxID=3366943 RepID=UPI0039817B32
MKKLRFVLIAMTLVCCKQETKQPKLIKLSGPVFGTGFNIQYYSEQETDYLVEINNLFDEVNQSLSTYLEDSDISKLNRNESFNIDHHFVTVYNASKSIYKTTEGVFDPTIGNVVNAWNFGAETNKFLTDSTTIDSLMQFVGFNKLSITGNKLYKPKDTYLEFNAIAKGYGVDVIADFFERNNIKNYLIEIGGEMRTSGTNVESKRNWTTGIYDPNFNGETTYSKVITLKNEAMATSGTYRKFKVDDNGNRYAHIINTKTGYPTKTNVLSVSVIAEDCMTADGYATAFQAMGVEKVTDFLKTHTELKVYFIYENEDQMLQTLSLNNFPK